MTGTSIAVVDPRTFEEMRAAAERRTMPAGFPEASKISGVS
jgi:hypothetical protein